MEKMFLRLGDGMGVKSSNFFGRIVDVFGEERACNLRVEKLRNWFLRTTRELTCCCLFFVRNTKFGFYIVMQSIDINKKYVTKSVFQQKQTQTFKIVDFTKL